MKKISFIIVLLISLVGSVCFANIPESEVALGGINLRSSQEYVESIYGEPSSYEVIDEGWTKSVLYNYNGTFKIQFSGKYISWIETTANNGIKTPSGIGVGMDVSSLQIYGEPYYDKVYKGIRQIAFWAPGRIVLEFGIRNNKIISIKARS